MNGRRGEIEAKFYGWLQRRLHIQGDNKGCGGGREDTEVIGIIADKNRILT
jgi:hypothetical protein